MRGRVRVPYIYKIKIKKKNIPIGLRFEGGGDIPKIPQKRNPGLRVASCVFGAADAFSTWMICKLKINHYIRTVKLKTEGIMENKKKSLSEEELEQVNGGMTVAIIKPIPIFKCKFCGEEYATVAERDEHQVNCSGKVRIF